MTFDSVLDRCVFQSDGCIVWEGARDGKGYPHYGLEGHNYRVFRTLYEMFRGFVPERHELHHTCGSKVCVNPFHVEAVTRGQHMVDDGRMGYRDELGHFRGLPGA